MKTKTKNAKKKGVMSTVNFALHKDLILKTPKGEVRSEWGKQKKLHMERRYEGSPILFLESRAHFMSLQIWISFFTIVDATFGIAISEHIYIYVYIYIYIYIYI